jgi:hypothetical protein
MNRTQRDLAIISKLHKENEKALRLFKSEAPYVKRPKKKVTRRLMKFLDARGKQTKTVNAADVKEQLNLD